MLDFRMPLHAIQLAGLIGHGGNRCAFGMREHREACRSLLNGHAMAHPRGLLGGGVGKNALGIINRGLGLAIFAQGGLIHLAAELVGHDLEAVADAEHRNTGLEYLSIYGRSTGLEYGGRATGQNNRLRILGQDLVNGHGMRDQFRVDAGLAYAAGDELGVLGTEVDDKHRTVCH